MIMMSVIRREKENMRGNRPSIDSNPLLTDNILLTFVITLNKVIQNERKCRLLMILFMTSLKKLEMLFSLSTIATWNDEHFKKLPKILFLHLKYPNIDCESSKMGTVFVREKTRS